MAERVGWTGEEYAQCPELAGRLHSRILDLEEINGQLEEMLRESERCRDSLRLERDGLEFVRLKDNEVLLFQRDKAQADARMWEDVASEYLQEKRDLERLLANATDPENSGDWAEAREAGWAYLQQTRENA